MFFSSCRSERNCLPTYIHTRVLYRQLAPRASREGGAHVVPLNLVEILAWALIDLKFFKNGLKSLESS